MSWELSLLPRPRGVFQGVVIAVCELMSLAFLFPELVAMCQSPKRKSFSLQQEVVLRFYRKILMGLIQTSHIISEDKGVECGRQGTLACGQGRESGLSASTKQLLTLGKLRSFSAS